MAAGSCLVAVAALAAPAPISAQGRRDADRALAQEHIDRAQQASERGLPLEAAEELKRAYLLSREPKTLQAIAITYQRLGNADLALHFIRKFLAEVDPKDPDREKAEALARELEASAPPAAEVDSTPTEDMEVAARAWVEPPTLLPPVAPAGLRHVPVGEAPPGFPLDLRIKMPPDAGGRTALLNYRGSGQPSYAQTAFAPGPAGLIARIPVEVMSSARTIEYYIESTGGEPLASGDAKQPNVVVVSAQAPPRVLNGPVHLSTAPLPRAEPAEPRRIRPAILATAGLSVVLLGTAAYYGSQAERVQVRLERLARGSSGRQQDGSWGYPLRPYGPELDRLDRDGRRYNVIALATLIGSLTAAAVSGVLYYLDLATWQRGQGGNLRNLRQLAD